MSYAPQSSPGPRLLPAWLLLATLTAGPLAAQAERRLDSPADLHREPDGTPLVSLPAGSPIETGEAKGAWREAAVEGWIFSPSTAPTRRDGFDLVVTSFVIQLVADRARALREVFRVLRPGGRIAYVTWLAGDVRFAPDAEFDAVLDELRLEGRDRGGGSPDVASPRAAADGLRRAGFRDVQASR